MTWIAKENRDGTVTIDKKVYEDLRRKAGEYEKLIGAIEINARKERGKSERD